jgi:FkbM family methyltransferase
MARELRGAVQRGALKWKYRKALNGGGPAVVEDALGFNFLLYPYDRANAIALLERAYDRSVFRAMQRLIRPGDIVFDVGAHIGEMSVLAARLCGPAGKVYAFEPVPDSCERIRENVALNAVQNIDVQPVAIGERTGTVGMNVFPAAYSGWNSLGQPVYAGSEGAPIATTASVEVPCTTLDEFCAAQEIARINFLKVDVEGYECEVFRGAARMLREQRIETICFEISQIPLKGAGRTAREVFLALETAGYTAYSYDEASGAFKGPVHDSDEFWTNYFASHKDMTK